MLVARKMLYMRPYTPWKTSIQLRRGEPVATSATTPAGET